MLGLIIGLLGIGLGYPGQPQVVTRYMAAKGRDEIRLGRVIAIVTEGNQELDGRVDHVIAVPATIDALQPLLTVIPLQLLAYHIALVRGCDVDMPRNLAKSVTVE